MDFNNNDVPYAINPVLNRMKLLPLIESCEMVWPTEIDIQLILPNYETDFRCLRTALENGSSQILIETANEDILNLQVLFITCCYEPTALILSEELFVEEQSLRERYIWKQIMHSKNRKCLIFLLFKLYRKTLLGEDWFYNFGSLCSFCAFVWDLLDYDRYMELLDRTVVELIEEVSFRMMKSKSVKLFIKGITLLEECIHKSHGHSLMEYETIFDELTKHTWRLSSKEGTNQRASIIMLAAMLECVRVLEVKRNPILTFVQNFTEPSRADILMNTILKGLKSSRSVSYSTFLMESLLKLLAIDHEGIQVISEHLLSDASFNNDGNTEVSSVVVMRKFEKIDLESSDWWKEILAHNKGRFHRWFEEILKLLVTEIDKFEKVDAVYFQFLCCTLFFLMDTKRLETTEQVECQFKPMVIFIKKMIAYIDLDQLAVVKEMRYFNVLRNCQLLVNANVACVQYYATCVPKIISNVRASVEIPRLHILN